MTSALERVRWIRRELAFLAKLRALPPRVAVFQWRARRLALRLGDEFSPVSATEPEKLAALLSLAENRRQVVELGTASGWTAVSLLLADRRRVVVSYDVVEHLQLERYLSLAGSAVTGRLELVRAAGEGGPSHHDLVDLLYIDSSHDRKRTIEEVQAWWPALRLGALVVFDDFTHPEYPGVREAVRDLRLAGEEREGLFVHETSTSVAPRAEAS
jgi:predicted O-methyltransferase YrrM